LSPFSVTVWKTKEGVNADANACLFEDMQELKGRKLGSLVCVEDLWRGDLLSVLQGLDTEGSIQRDGQIPSQNVPAYKKGPWLCHGPLKVMPSIAP
jgi:hypothetical protein